MLFRSDRPYIVEGNGNVKTTLQLVLRHGKAVHHFEMAGISDSVSTDVRVVVVVHSLLHAG